MSDMWVSTALALFLSRLTMRNVPGGGRRESAATYEKTPYYLAT